MNRRDTTIILAFITIAPATAMYGWLGFLLGLFLMSFPLYLIWFDSKLPPEKQWRFYNSKLGREYYEKED